MKNFLKLSGILLLLASFIFAASSCAGSKDKSQGNSDTSTSQDSYDEIEQLLGITPEDRNNADTPAQEDDLLTLLQSNTEENNTSPQEQINELEDPRILALKNEVSELKRESKEKDKTIMNLKQQVKVLEEDKAKGPVASQARPVNFGGNVSGDEYRRKYDEGLQLAYSRQYRQAITHFEGLLAANSNHSLSDNAQYWIGECYYALGDFRAAIVAFEKVFIFEKSNKNDYAQYKLGLCYYKLNEAERAREEFQSLIDNYQNSDLIVKAQQYISKL